MVTHLLATHKALMLAVFLLGEASLATMCGLATFCLGPVALPAHLLCALATWIAQP